MQASNNQLLKSLYWVKIHHGFAEKNVNSASINSKQEKKIAPQLMQVTALLDYKSKTRQALALEA